MSLTRSILLLCFRRQIMKFINFGKKITKPYLEKCCRRFPLKAGCRIVVWYSLVSSCMFFFCKKLCEMLISQRLKLVSNMYTYSTQWVTCMGLAAPGRPICPSGGLLCTQWACALPPKNNQINNKL